MKTSLEIINKLSEKEVVKLESQLVELGVLQEVQKELAIAEAGAIKSITIAKSALKPAQESLRLNRELLVKFQNFTKQIKDLGITAPQKEVEDGIVTVKKNIKLIETLITNLHII